MPVRLSGSTSGYVELVAPAVAGTTVLELPTDSIKPGLVLITTQAFSAASSVAVDGCFTSDYDNYRIVCAATPSAASGGGDMQMRLRVASVDASGAATYRKRGYYQDRGAGVNGMYADDTAGFLGTLSNGFVYLSADVFSPFLAARTAVSASSVGNEGSAGMGFSHTAATAYDGFTLYPASGTITGSVSVYGYRK